MAAAITGYQQPSGVSACEVKRSQALTDTAALLQCDEDDLVKVLEM
jgi:hypothetical protein